MKLKNLLGLSILALLILPVGLSSAAWEWCYQETANESTSCGGLSTGSYSTDSVPPNTVGAFYFYINYAKPENATGALWQVKHGTLSPANYTVPSGCFNRNPIRFKIMSKLQASGFSYTTSSQGYCYDGSSWTALTPLSSTTGLGASSSGYKYYLWDGDWNTGVNYWDDWTMYDPVQKGWNIYEEGIWWNMTIPEPPSDTCTYSGSGDWIINCSDNCDLTTDTSINGDVIIQNDGGSGVVSLSGTWTFTSTDQYITIESGCSLEIKSGGGINA